jgi:hypothetical protein
MVKKMSKMAKTPSFILNLEDQPSDAQLKKIQMISLILSVAIYALMAYVFFLSGSPVENMMAGQLSFDGYYLKWQIYLFTEDLGLYRIAQVMDYGFMLGYGLLIFTSALRVSRGINKDSLPHKIGMYMAVSGIIAAIFDACENLFILLTLMEPFGFPDVLGVIHSCFALVKWILIYTSIITTLVLYFYKKFKK